MSTPRALAYCRQSEDSEQGIERQLEQITDLCERNGWPIVGRYIDNDETADAKKRQRQRPDYTRLLADAEAGLGDVIVFQTTDRLLRDVRDMEDFIDYVERTGIQVASAQLGPIRLDTVDGRLNARLGAVIARAELERRRKRQVDQQRQAAEKGESAGRRAFGYRLEIVRDEEGEIVRDRRGKPVRQWVEDPAEGAVVREAFDRLINRGHSISEITAWMNTTGLRTAAQGREWNRRGVRYLLLSARYCGQREYHRGKKDELVVTGNWPKIITVEQHEQTVKLLSDPVRTTTIGNARRHVGTGLYLCGCDSCKGQKPVRTLNRHNGIRVYACTDYHLARAADPVDKMVLGAVEGYLARPDGPAKLLAGSDVPEIAELRAQRDRLEAKIARAQRDYDDELIDAADLRAVKVRRQAEIKVINAKIAAATKTSQLTALAAAPDPVAAFRNLGLNLRREVINALVAVTLLPAKRGRSTFDPDAIKVEWR